MYLLTTVGVERDARLNQTVASTLFLTLRWGLKEVTMNAYFKKSPYLLTFVGVESQVQGLIL